MNYLDCSDIYREETDNSLNNLKRLREAWTQVPSRENMQLFQYADNDFYFYRYIVDRQEKNSRELFLNILYRILDRYGYSFQVPEDIANPPFDFIVCEKNRRIGYKITDFFEDEDENRIIEDYKLDEAVVIKAWKPGRSDKWVEMRNNQAHADGISVNTILAKDFFNEYFGAESYSHFTEAIDEYLLKARDIIGYQSLRFLSSMNLATRKSFEEKFLLEFDYNNYKYQIIDSKNSLVKKYLHLIPDESFIADYSHIAQRYLGDELYKTMIGTNDYAESFITSEWLFYSLKGRKNFDYTSIISGYLKSIEQLLYRIVMMNIDNDCKIGIKKNMLRKAIKNNIPVYELIDDSWVLVPVKNNKCRFSNKDPHPYVEFTKNNKRFMDTSMGAFEHFIIQNPKIFVKEEWAEAIANMIGCFRIECRNGYFHTHNLHDWDIAKKTQHNAIYLYSVLLGASRIPLDKTSELGIISESEFDTICKKIRMFRHYNTAFVFEYDNDERVNCVYDFINNTVEYNEDGTEHYESLTFYKVDDFSMETYEKLDEGIREEQILLLTKDSVPKKIYGVNRNNELEEII